MLILPFYVIFLQVVIKTINLSISSYTIDIV